MTVFATSAVRKEHAKHVLLDKDIQGNQKAEWKMLVNISNWYLSHERNCSEFRTKSPQ